MFSFLLNRENESVLDKYETQLQWPEILDFVSMHEINEDLLDDFPQISLQSFIYPHLNDNLLIVYHMSFQIENTFSFMYSIMKKEYRKKSSLMGICTFLSLPLFLAFRSNILVLLIELLLLFLLHTSYKFSSNRENRQSF